MALLGNLLTDEFDREARQSLQMFAAAGGLSSLQSKLSAEHPICLFACATLQNVTSLDPIGCCNVLREQGCAGELSRLVTSGDEDLSSYATAVLANLRAYDPNPEANDGIEEAIRMRRLAAIVEQMRSGKAVASVQGAAKRWVERRRAAKAVR